jgi:hypothetical protein
MPLVVQDRGLIALKVWIEKLRGAQGFRQFTEYYDRITEEGGGVLGEGSFGKVYKAKVKATGDIVAVKNIDKSSMDRFEM